MTTKEFQSLTENGPVLLDGGTGSCLRAMGMPVGVCTEVWAYEHPEMIERLQNEYIEAGSQVIYAPTFGANRESLGNLKLADRTEELNKGLAKRTLANAKGRVFVAGDISTTGKAMEPYGPMTYAGLMDIYKEQIGFLEEAGAELLGAETLLSLDEALVICDAAHAVCSLPLMVSFSCEGDGSLYFGGTVYEAAAALEAMGVDAVGVNCSDPKRERFHSNYGKAQRGNAHHHRNRRGGIQYGRGRVRLQSSAAGGLRGVHNRRVLRDYACVHQAGEGAVAKGTVIRWGKCGE